MTCIFNLWHSLGDMLQVKRPPPSRLRSKLFLPFPSMVINSFTPRIAPSNTPTLLTVSSQLQKMTNPDPISRSSKLSYSNRNIQPFVEVNPRSKKMTNKHATTVCSIPEPKSKANRMATSHGTSATSIDPDRFIRSQAPSPEDFRTREESHREHRCSYAYTGSRERSSDNHTVISQASKGSTSSETERNEENPWSSYTGLFFGSSLSKWHPESAFGNLEPRNH